MTAVTVKCYNVAGRIDFRVCKDISKVVHMEFEQLIKRINELSRKSKTEGLTPAEKDEQTKLRNEYRALVVGNLSSQLNSMKIKNPDGTVTDLKKKQ